MTPSILSSLFLGLLATLSVGTAAQAATYVVDRLDDAIVSDCTAAANDCTLRGAITAANANSIYSPIEFAPSLTGTITLGGTALPAVSTNITGPGAKVITISGNDANGIFNLLSGTNIRISGLTLSGGNATNTGAGGQATGGAINVANGASLEASKLWIKDCKALGGGGIESFGNLSVYSCTFSGNSATIGTGGAIHSTPNSGSLIIANSTFINNRAADSGGAIRSDGANARVDNSTIAANLADSDGNGTGRGGGISSSGGAFAIRNSIVTGNGPDDADNVATDGGFNYVGGRAVDAGLENNGRTLTLKDNGGPTPTVAINISGTAFNGGNPNFDGANTPNDQRGEGFARKKAGRLDIGAYELQVETPSLVVTTNEDSLADDDQTSLREAILFANSNFDNSNITFAPSVRGTISLQSALPDVKFATIIRGPGANKLTIARGAGTISFGLLVLDADRNNAFNAAISGLSFTGGNTAQGGAIYAKKANLTITDCAFFGNTAGNGGAVAGAAESTFVVRNSTFNSNISTHNGGAFSTLNLATLEQCTFDGNTATDFGGGVFGVNYGSAPGNTLITFDSCTITNNRAQSSSNGKGGNGGGINVLNSQPVLRNCIVAGNTRGADGSIRDDIAGTVDGSSANNLIGDVAGSSGVVNGTKGNKVGGTGGAINPGLDALKDNGGPTQTRALLASSPALNAGNTDLTRDQRGVRRPQNGADDMGAFETASANTPPQLSNETISAQLNVSLIHQLKGTDLDGDTLTYALNASTLPVGLALNTSTGVISGKPTVAGRTDFSVDVTDGKATATARFILIVSSTSDSIGPVLVRDSLESSYTRDQLAALSYRGTVRDVAPNGVTPSGVNRLLFQLRKGSTSYSGPTDGFTANVGRGYYAAFIGTPSPNTTAGTREFRRTFSTFIPASLIPGAYSLVIAAQDNAGNYSVEVVPVIITAPTPAPSPAAIMAPTVMSPFGTSGSGGDS